MGNIVYNENSKQFIMIPDGDVATHEQIKNKYDSLISNMIPKEKVEQLIKLIDADIEYNKKSIPQAKIDPLSGNTIYRQTTVVYSPETIRKHLEKLL